MAADSPPDGTQTGSSAFRPRARIIQTLGRDLIQNEVVALQELVKNAYDADATRVTLTFKGSMAPGKGELVVQDDGHGMTLDVVKESWMEPATIDKARRKESPGGRRVTGEKGIGRFAASRIAERLVIESIAPKPHRIVKVEIDWGSFEDHGKYLDEIHCEWTEGPAPKGTSQGTKLRLIGLRESWRSKGGQKRLEDVRTRLARLISPFDDAPDFAIHLRPPKEFPNLKGRISPPEVLARPHYKLKGSLSADGTLTCAYEIEGRKRINEETGQIFQVIADAGQVIDDEGKPTKIILADGRPPGCGPFDFEFRVWDRRPEDLQPLAEELDVNELRLRQDLNAVQGINVYRDKFRVAFQKDDWLGLDERRVQNPTLRLGSNQIVGVVSITADDNQGLIDQSNRQALQDTPAFDDFQEGLKEILKIIETKRHGARREAPRETPSAGIFQKLDLSNLQKYVQERYPKDKTLEQEVQLAAVQVKEGAKQAQEVISRYRRLATLGTIMDRLLHEGRTPLGSIESQVDLAQRDKEKLPAEKFHDKLEGRFNTIKKQARKLKGLFDRIEPFSGRKRRKYEEVALEDLIADAAALHEKNIKAAKIAVSLPTTKTPFRCHPGDVESVFLNLFDNAIYWLKKKPEDERKVVIEVKQERERVRVTFSDSGPGVPSEIQDYIWDAYFSDKPDGVGLGLSIAGETMLDYDGRLELVGGGPLPGATFELSFQQGKEKQ